ncbi:MAG: chloride channel protein [Chloroflexi bacterium]|nr:chloride channel protein [Chloroflexota bacterium]
MFTRLRAWRRNADRHPGASGTAGPEDVARLRAEQARNRAKRRAFWQRAFRTVDEMFHVNPADFLAFLRAILKWTLLGGAVGILSGTASAIFLVSLDWATRTRLANPTILLILPLAGFAVGWIYYRFAGAAAQGNNLVIEEVHSNQSRIPLRMAPLVLLGTVITHLFGGSAGREGTAIQMGASLSDALRRALRLNPEDRRLMIMAGISGGFGSVFGTPVAGFVFGMEVQSVGRIRYEGMIPCLVAAYIGDIVTRLWGVGHSHYPALAHVEIEPLLLLKVALAGIAFGLTSILFVELTHGIKHLQSRLVSYPPLRPFIGGLLIVALTLLLGTQDYLGLGLPLIHQSVGGDGVVTFAFLLKLIFTALTLGSGFLGGEVTPLFVIGSTLGYTLGGLLGVDPTFMASIGFVAVFAGASNTPLACALMAMELFGGGSPVYLILGCAVAYLASGHRGIYVTQRIGSPKSLGVDVHLDESLKALADRRGGWLPHLPQIAGEPARRLVRAVMSTRVISVREDTPLTEGVALALREGVRALPVLNAQKVVVGIIADNDLRRAGIEVNLTRLKQMTSDERAATLQAAANVSARAVMSPTPVTISHMATLAEAADLLIGADLKRLPVTDAAGHLMGMLTRSDILREIVFSGEATAKGQETAVDWLARVGDVALEAAATIGLMASLRDAVESMRTSGRKRLIVIDSTDRVVGILTESDLLSRASNGERAQVLELLGGRDGGRVLEPTGAVGQIMTTPVLTVQAEGLAADALRLMIENQIKRLPVVDAAGRVQGMVGRAGLMRVLFNGRGR